MQDLAWNKAFFERVKYKPHSRAQWSYHQSKARFRVACCGRRFGKSKMAGIDECTRLVIPRDSGNKYLCWIVGPTYDLAEKEFRVIWDTLMIGQKFAHDKRVKRTYNKKQGDMYIEFPWGTRVEVRSASHPESLVGEGLDRIIMSEAAKHKLETWTQILRPSLADKRGCADFPTTPEGHNWLYDIWRLGKINEPGYESWNFPSWLNTYLFPGGEQDEEIQAMKRAMGEEEFMQEICANFSSFVGKIYGEFDENKHVRAHTFNPMWPNYMFVDFGYTNAFAAIEAQIDPWDNVYVWREHVKSYANMPEHIAIMRNRVQPAGYRLDMAFGDAADPAGISEINGNLVRCVGMNEAKVNWREGIDLVKRFLKLHAVGFDEWGTPIEVPKMFIDPSCVHTIHDFNNYRRKPTEVVQDSNKAGAARQVDDHTLDAIRYGLMHIFKLGAQHHLSETVEDYMPRGVFKELGIETPSSDLWLPSNDSAGHFSGNMEF